MSKTRDSKYTELIALKVTPGLAADIRRQARSDDRTVSGYLRRVLAANIQHSKPTNADAPEDARGK